MYDVRSSQNEICRAENNSNGDDQQDNAAEHFTAEQASKSLFLHGYDSADADHRMRQPARVAQEKV